MKLRYAQLVLPDGYMITSGLAGGDDYVDDTLWYTLWQWRKPRKRLFRRQEPARWCFVAREWGGVNYDSHRAEIKLIATAQRMAKE